MAVTSITKINLVRNTGTSMPTLTAVDSTDGAEIEFDASDEKTLIFLKNTDTSTSLNATIKAGNGIFSGGSDLEITVGAGVTKLVVIESGKYKNISGTNKGKLLIEGVANLSAACVVLP